MDVSLEAIKVARDGRIILDVPSLQLRGGRTTAILGPNGSGKTTLLRVIAGLEQPNAGRVLIGGSPVDHSRIAYVFQEQVFLRRSVRYNLELGLNLRGLRAPEMQERIEAAAKLLGIKHIMEQRADRLSGGEGRRVSLARALCLHAPLVLLDEPLEGLDRQTYQRLVDELPKLLAAMNATRVFVTHSRQEALRFAEDLIVVMNGQVHASGDRRDVMTNPQTAEVAEALGYFVLNRGGLSVAIPPDSLKPGPGPVEFSMDVEEVVDLVESKEIVGHIGDFRVRVRLPENSAEPSQGSRIQLHTERAYELKRTVTRDEMR
jgi:ABC-type sugar transport system ATPase subunit